MTEIRTADLLAELGITRGRLSQLSQEGLKVAKVRHGYWNHELVREWMAKRQELTLATTAQTSAAIENMGTLTEQFLVAKIRLENLKAVGQEARNDRLLAKSVNRDTVLEELAMMAGRFIGVLNEWVREAGDAHGERARLRAANDLRSRLANDLDTFARVSAAGEDVAPTRIRYTQ